MDRAIEAGVDSQDVPISVLPSGRMILMVSRGFPDWNKSANAMYLYRSRENILLRTSSSYSALSLLKRDKRWCMKSGSGSSCRAKSVSCLSIRSWPSSRSSFHTSDRLRCMRVCCGFGVWSSDYRLTVSVSAWYLPALALYCWLCCCWRFAISMSTTSLSWMPRMWLSCVSGLTFLCAMLRVVWGSAGVLWGRMEDQVMVEISALFWLLVVSGWWFEGSWVLLTLLLDPWRDFVYVCLVK